MATLTALWNQAKTFCTTPTVKRRMRAAVHDGLIAPVIAIAIFSAAIAVCGGLPKTEAMLSKLVPHHSSQHALSAPPGP